ncbi:hypothetical protein MBAV_003396 [Candidatus Magnetobacterium bavaricum]|uniref:Uncharacterized protein n=1 Tax=Candidatus Magnetobacterium bavaricum TaxID=29290 RepID=A0A0F3GR41_9BACT|nr:hypothetical protein MBAV_003396 [Candidatus Magnetobacterium bavaricum]
MFETLIVPLMFFSMIIFAEYSPRPVPLTLAFVVKYGSNTFPIISSLMPPPLSVIVKMTVSVCGF